MSEPSSWSVLDQSAPVSVAAGENPLASLACGDIAAIICRGAFPPQACQQVVQQLVGAGLLYDPGMPISDKFREMSIPENYYYRDANSLAEKEESLASQPEDRLRIDVGTSLGTRGSDPDSFFAHASETRALFASLFGEDGGPVGVIYQQLEALAVGKTVQTAQEADGRIYGPAIFRAHYGGFTYKPHFDSVRNREERTDFSVYAFEHQFAGVLVLQNTVKNGESAQARLHRCFWSPEVDPHLKNDTFHEYARQNAIPSLDIVLQPGDLYFFNTGCIHEVAGVSGKDARIVLATFIGYGSRRKDVYVWS